MQIWAVDISKWTEEQGSKEELEPLLDLFFGHEAPLQQGGANDSSSSSALKVMRYIRPVDRIRSLAALLLPRVMYLEQQKYQETSEQLTWKTLSFQRTKEGRPFLVPTESNPHPVDFNLSHDGDWVVLACTASESQSQLQHQHRIGVDVMSLTLPHYESSVDSFIETMADTMTSAEEKWVRQDPHQSLYRLYQLWTHKEALTKNMGIGLGFDFKRIELSFWESDGGQADTVVLVLDGQVDTRYRFTSVDLQSPTRATPSLLVVCEGPFTSQQTQRQLSPTVTQQDAVDQHWLAIWGVSDLVQTAKDLVNR